MLAEALDRQWPKELVDVIMFTDGDGSFRDERGKASCFQRARIHVIALGSSSDSSVLLKIRAKGYEPGYFGYARTSDELVSKIAEASDLACSNTVMKYRGHT